MGTAPEQRRALADFLKTRRQQVDCAELPLPHHGRGRSVGLRREDVSHLSGVSITWYTWLEQARDIQPSRQVLEALSRTLQLSGRETAYVLELAGYSSAALGSSGDVQGAPPHIQRLLDALDPYPSYAITSAWDIVGWNHAYEALYPNVAKVEPEDRNLLWLVFTDPDVRQLLPNWAIDSGHFIAQFRAEAGPRLSERAFSTLVGRLVEASEEFRAGWESHDIEQFASRERWFHHPLIGDVRLEHHRLDASDHPDLHLVIYTAEAGSAAADQFRNLRKA